MLELSTFAFYHSIFRDLAHYSDSLILCSTFNIYFIDGDLTIMNLI